MLKEIFCNTVPYLHGNMISPYTFVILIHTPLITVQLSQTDAIDLNRWAIVLEIMLHLAPLPISISNGYCVLVFQKSQSSLISSRCRMNIFKRFLHKCCVALLYHALIKNITYIRILFLSVRIMHTILALWGSTISTNTPISTAQLSSMLLLHTH